MSITLIAILVWIGGNVGLLSIVFVCDATATWRDARRQRKLDDQVEAFSRSIPSALDEGLLKQLSSLHDNQISPYNITGEPS